MNRTKRLRRVLILCNNSSRNLAFYRAGWHNRRPLFGGEFGITVNSNFFDVCILEWCKLFADKRDPHNWQNIVGDPTAFEVTLMQQLGCKPYEFADLAKKVRSYRDKFIAHLDSEEVMRLPTLDFIRSSVFFYYQHIMESDAAGTTAEEPKTLEERFALWSREGAHYYATLKSQPMAAL